MSENQEEFDEPLSKSRKFRFDRYKDLKEMRKRKKSPQIILLQENPSS